MTAVEWLMHQMLEASMDTQTGEMHIKLPKDAFQQAKEMEKKIIAQAFEDGDYNYFYSKKTGREFENGIDYYNEKFKSE